MEQDDYRSIGVCVGASTLSLVTRNGEGFRAHRYPHDGKVSSKLEELLAPRLPANVGITGRKFKNRLAVPTLAEPEAIELAYRQIRAREPQTDCIISLGGETFIAYLLNRHGKIREVHSGNKCAAGTGEFFLQQIRRMGLDLDEAMTLAAADAPYPVAGRCSVFCKTDCTHALNKGIDKGRVTAGLCRMIAEKIIELLKKCKAQHIAVIGGVSRNRIVVRMLQDTFPQVAVPQEAPYFEALGALLWAEEHENPLTTTTALFTPSFSSFETIPRLDCAAATVSFLEPSSRIWTDGDYLIGLDVGSTTTKAVLVRSDDCTITASAYLRTNGDPVGASRACYRSLHEQLPEHFKGRFIGVGVTGSGRRIAGLHAQSGGVVNEIVAHAAAAAHFDPEVETIFEIGGQDAKYTWLVNRVASDYAMNEACSAGTGSFLEESCGEVFGIPFTGIADIALGATSPLNFRDQCAAFIGSDIASAIQEGHGREDIIAGLVYSICQNYLNRVKGNRPIGRKVFMQGGVCYNRAVPLAMANLCGRDIVVPPEPGLMGAFGAALELRSKLDLGLLAKGTFDLRLLAGRDVAFAAPFTCRGGKEGCDRKCSISRVVIDDHTYPFGGACNRFDNLQHPDASRATGHDLVLWREKAIWRPPAATAAVAPRRRVGIPASLFTHGCYPLYAEFFSRLGLEVVTSPHPDPDGMNQAGAAFCHPVVQGHGFVKDILDQQTDFVFIPHVKNPSSEQLSLMTCACPFVQSEPYYLKAAFHERLAPKLVSDVFDFSDYKRLQQAFIRIGKQIGASPAAASKAFAAAWQGYNAVLAELREHGRQTLQALRPDETAIVLFGRPYNAFTRHGNLGIPQKFTSRGYTIIPCDLLPQPENDTNRHFTERMYWAAGQTILRAAAYIRDHPNLFAVYITNFSCGPDSFLLGFFREVMGSKPALVLELDAHTADAGVDTRIEAFLDVIAGYRQVRPPAVVTAPRVTPRLEANGNQLLVTTVAGQRLPLTDPQVRMLVPSMGETTTRAFCKALNYAGINAVPLEPPGTLELNLGKGEATCKECLPLLLTCGSILKYAAEHHQEPGINVLFFPETNGPCRFGQYVVFMKNLAHKKHLDNLAFFSPTFENGYAGLPRAFFRRAWLATCISDALDDLYAAILVLAADPVTALEQYRTSREVILNALASQSHRQVLALFRQQMHQLSTLSRTSTYTATTRILLTGEIYVRRDGFSRQNLVERLAAAGIIVRIAPVAEWIHFSNYCTLKGYIGRAAASFREQTKLRLKEFFMHRDEESIQHSLELSGFCERLPDDVADLVTRGRRLLEPSIAQETNLIISSAISAVGDEVHGVINIGPFGCMPCRVAEAITICRIQEEKAALSKDRHEFWKKNASCLTLPFLSIETDGSVFPQVIEARLESFILATHRLKQQLGELRPDNRSADCD